MKKKPDYSRYEHNLIALTNQGSSIYIKEIGRDYIILESSTKRSTDSASDIEITLNFDMTDNDDCKLLNEFRKVYDWYKRFYKGRKNLMPVLHCELKLSALLKALAD